MHSIRLLNKSEGHSHKAFSITPGTERALRERGIRRCAVFSSDCLAQGRSRPLTPGKAEAAQHVARAPRRRLPPSRLPGCQTPPSARHRFTAARPTLPRLIIGCRRCLSS